MYTNLANSLNKSHKSLYQVCKELDIDINLVNVTELTKHIDQCTHCGVWARRLIQDLDDNPICDYCVKLIGL